jgi:hypothetical protein
MLGQLKQLPKFLLYPIIILTLVKLWVMYSIPLIDDEAYHWSWTLNLSYSYFDHPGMVAWMIALPTKIFGHHPFFIRLPALISFFGICFLLYKIAKEMFDQSTANLTAALLFFVPLWSFAGLSTMPDTPLALFWLLCFYCFWKSVNPNPNQRWSIKKSWLLIGLFMGLGMNSKLSCCLIGLGFGLYLLMNSEYRRHLFTRWPWIAMLITFIVMIPVFVWNSKNQWASFEYQFFRRHHEASGFDINRLIQFLVIQMIFISPFFYFNIVKNYFILFTFKKIHQNVRLALLVAMPTLFLFGYQSSMAAYKPHWSGPAYLILMPAIVFSLKNYLLSPQNAFQKLIKFLILGFFFLMQMLWIPLITPIIPKVYGLFSQTKWNPQWDFTNEIYGWDKAAQKVFEIKAALESKGEKVIIGAQRYEMIAQLTYAAFIYEHSLSNSEVTKVWQLTRGIDQYRFEQTEEEKNHHKGSTALVVVSDKYDRDPRDLIFSDSCIKHTVTIERANILAREIFIYECKNFQGTKK